MKTARLTAGQVEAAQFRVAASQRLAPPPYLTVDAWQLNRRRPSGERDRLDGDEYAGDVGPEADIARAGFGPGKNSAYASFISL